MTEEIIIGNSEIIRRKGHELMTQQNMSELKNGVKKWISDNSQIFTDVSHRIWEYAELSLKEYNSAELFCRVLSEGGFTVTRPLCGMDTAFSGSFGEGKPIIALLGEYDALSGLSQKAGSVERCEDEKISSGHGCGHNMLGAGALAAAFAVKHYLEQTGKSGTVVFYGCPGEEGGAGKAFMARERLWETVDAALTWHPDDVNRVVTGTNNSCIQVLYKFKGVAAHAAGNPEQGRSALDAVELMNIGVQYLREHTKPDARIHYAMVDGGGVSPNVVQPTASVLYMVRSILVKDALKLQERVDDIAKGAALMTGTSFDRVFIDGCANALPNHTLERLLYDNFENTELPSYTTEELKYAERLKSTFPEGASSLPGVADLSDTAFIEKVKLLSNNGGKVLNDFLLPLYTGYYFSPGSSDVGDVSQQTPTAQINAVTFPSGSPGHSWQNVSCGKTSVGDKGLILAAQVLAATVVDLFESPELLQKARNEFIESSRETGGYVCPIPDGAVPTVI